MSLNHPEAFQVGLKAAEIESQVEVEYHLVALTADE